MQFQILAKQWVPPVTNFDGFRTMGIMFRSRPALEKRFWRGRSDKKRAAMGSRLTSPRLVSYSENWNWGGRMVATRRNSGHWAKWMP